MTANYDEDDQQVRRSHRRASNGAAHPRGSGSNRPSLSSSSADNPPPSSNGSSRRRVPSSSASSSRSVDSSGSGSGGDAMRSPSSRNSGGSGTSDSFSAVRWDHRRASASGAGSGAPPRRSRSEDLNDLNSSPGEDDMGYGDAAPDMGYGDASPDMTKPPGEGDKQQPTRSRRQRRCSIAELTSTNVDNVASAPEGGVGEPDYGYGGTAAERPRLQRNSSGDFSSVGASTNTISNIAIPMADQDAPKRKNRRGSMFGAISRNVIPSSTKEIEAPDKTKKPGADRDRRRQGTLLDRVGAGSDARGSRSGPSTSYSDRIMSK